jgi:hypothetical protein
MAARDAGLKAKMLFGHAATLMQEGAKEATNAVKHTANAATNMVGPKVNTLRSNL